MSHNPSNAAKSVFKTLCLLEPRIRPLKGWFDGFVSKVQLWYESEGNQGVKRAKDSLGVAWLKLLGEPLGDPLKFVATDNNIPRTVIPFLKFFSKNKRDRRLLSVAWTLVHITDCWIAKHNDSTFRSQLRVISQSKLPVKAKSVIQDFGGFLRQLVKECPNKKFAKQLLKGFRIQESGDLRESEMVLSYSDKRGPNGKRTLNANKDVVTLRHARVTGRFDSALAGLSLWDVLQDTRQMMCECSSYAGSTLVNRDPFTNALDEDLDPTRTASKVPGKITGIPEKSGKIRLVAQADYYSQQTMYPVHKWLEGVLRTFPTDCTFDQRSAIPHIQKWQREGRHCHSFDQSSCTDLFPLEMQAEVLKLVFPEPLVNRLLTVMVDREWEVRLPSGQTERVMWSVGQPMGLYGSWPLMAVTHHLLVQYCYWLTRGRVPLKEFFQQYTLLGDDISFGSNNVALMYLKVVKSLGMKINLAKSHITGGHTGIAPTSEFAKITICDGEILHPLKPNMVKRALEDYRLAPMIVKDLAGNGLRIPRSTAQAILHQFFPPHLHDVADTILDAPRLLGGLGYTTSRSLSEMVRSETLEGHYPKWIDFLGRKLQKKLRLQSELSTNLTLVEIDMSPRFIKDHPLNSYMSTDAYRRMRDVSYETPPFQHRRLYGGYGYTVNQQACEYLIRKGISNAARFLREASVLDDPDYQGFVPPQGIEEKEQRRMTNIWMDIHRKPTRNAAIHYGISDTQVEQICRTRIMFVQSLLHIESLKTLCEQCAL